MTRRRPYPLMMRASDRYNTPEAKAKRQLRMFKQASTMVEMPEDIRRALDAVASTNDINAVETGQAVLQLGLKEITRDADVVLKLPSLVGPMVVYPIIHLFEAMRRFAGVRRVPDPRYQGDYP